MKKIFFICFLLFVSPNLYPQNTMSDSLKQFLSISKEDTNKVWTLYSLSRLYAWSFADTAVMFAKEGLQLFTTKPTGQGTGLGLSLAYDIVKAHGGELKADTKQEEGTTFIIKLPITQL